MSVDATQEQRQDQLTPVNISLHSKGFMIEVIGKAAYLFGTALHCCCNAQENLRLDCLSALIA